MCPRTEMTVYGSYGELTVCAYTGIVLAYVPSEDGNDYHDVFRVDLAEYCEAYPDAALPGSHVDILAVGFWSARTPVGYEAAESDYRNWAKVEAAWQEQAARGYPA